MDDYVKLAMRTCAPGDNLLHSALGMVTEIAELAGAPDEANAHEEMGDVMWYVAVGCDHFGVTLKEAIEAAPESDRDGLSIMGDYVNHVKRQVFYGKPVPSSQMVALLGEMAVGIQEAAEDFGFDFEEILEENIAKLRKRFPEKFTQDRAINRE